MRHVDDSAFPSTENATDGMTIREWYASLAMIGLLAAEAGLEQRDTYAETAKEAFKQADAMLAQTTKEKT